MIVHATFASVGFSARLLGSLTRVSVRLTQVNVTRIQSYEYLNGSVPVGESGREPVDLYNIYLSIPFWGDSMFTSRSVKGVLATSLLAVSAGAASAVTISGWDTGNVVVGADPVVVGETGFSYVYDGDVSGGTDGLTTSGRIAFTPPEAVSPGIKVDETDVQQGGKDGILLEGCLMTNNPPNPCDGPFQSGKRIKQQMTGFGPVDLVFNLDFTGGTDADPVNDPTVYQVFHRLINVTGKALDGFTIQLGFGTGDDFVQAGLLDGLSFSQDFRAQPSGSGAASTQFPFGLFGDASSNPNFTLDGFYAPARTGFDVAFNDVDPETGIVATELASLGFFGPYGDLFGAWLSQDSVPMGALWEYDPTKDPLVMAWLNPDGKWELRRDFGDANNDGSFDKIVGDVISLTGDSVMYFDTLEAVQAYLGLGTAVFGDVIEDLANLNVNFGIHLDHDLLAQGLGGEYGSFTMRTIVAPVPLPAAAPLLLAGLGALAMVRRRRRHAA